jgi:hypothetical protein
MKLAADIIGGVVVCVVLVAWWAVLAWFALVCVRGLWRDVVRDWRASHHRSRGFDVFLRA